jgi:hypothetical protein
MSRHRLSPSIVAQNISQCVSPSRSTVFDDYGARALAVCLPRVVHSPTEWRKYPAITKIAEMCLQKAVPTYVLCETRVDKMLEHSRDSETSSFHGFLRLGPLGDGATSVVSVALGDYLSKRFGLGEICHASCPVNVMPADT